MKKPYMEENLWYDLDPPACVGGNIFRRVFCEEQVSGYPNELVVRGVPEGGNKAELFILNFIPNGRVGASQSADQG